MEVRPARAAELAAVMTVLDSGHLEVPVERARSAVADGRLLVAVEDSRILGALLLTARGPPASAEVEAVAVRPGRRGQGIGTRLVGAAADRYDRLVAEFDPGVRPFWASLGFDVAAAEAPARLVGRLDREPRGA